jgi:DNA-binding beta-propeller fold protein YncE
LQPGPNLAPGSDPSVLPGDVLVADEGNNRLLVVDPAGKIVWQFPRPGDLARGTTFLEPDDAFFTPSGRNILATEENDQVVSLVGLQTHRLLWRYGTPGVPGSGPDELSNPDDAMMLPNGDVLVADIKNCSLLLVRGRAHAPAERIGIQDTFCLHEPPLRFGSPNGAFPLTNGNYLVTEINGDWADEITLGGRVLWSTHPPGVAYPSDTNEVSSGRYLTVDYSNPGQIVEFDKQGKLLWRYGPRSGPGKLTTPSLCEPIPTNGDVLCNDDGNDRVIVVDPRTDKIVWQYGHDGIPGSAPGYLSGPDGVDLAPPYSLLVRHGPTMGLPTWRCAAGLPAGACTVLGTP